MNRKLRPDVIKQSKEANVRERRKLARRIEGHGGINAQYRFDSQQTRHECALLRRELAQAIVDETKRKRNDLNLKRSERRMSRDNDPTLLLLKEREERRRRKNFRLLLKAQERQRRSGERVKEFVAKLDREEKMKRDAAAEKISDILVLVNGIESTEMDGGAGGFFSNPNSRPVSRAWREARNTRYIRTRILRDFEIELSANEIFSSNEHHQSTPRNKSRMSTASKSDKLTPRVFP